MKDEASAAPPTRAGVETWLSNVRADIETISRQLEPLLAEQNRLRAREALLVKLLQSFDGADTAIEERVRPAAPQERSGPVRDYVRDCVVEILNENGGAPMHIAEIHRRFLAKGFRVPGAGEAANLTAHLGRCDGIVSPTRGLYALGAKTPAKKGPRRKRRRTR